jgi:hypothetical protein
MKKLIRNMSDKESAAFWAGVERTAASAKDLPAWMKAGVDVNPVHFVTSEPRSDVSSNDSPPRTRNRK